MNKRNWIIVGGILLVVLVWMLWPKSQESEIKVEKVDQARKVEPVNVTAIQIHQTALAKRKEGQLGEAKALYQQIFTDHPDAEDMPKIQRELGDLNINIIMSNMPNEYAIMHEVVSGDTLGELAKTYKTTIELIKLSNNLKNNIIRIGQRLRIWTGAFNIFVDKSQNILILKQGDEVLKVYDVSTGEHNSTPVGEYKVTTRLEDPVWFNRGVVVPPESPQNVLGTRWLGFNIPGYGIHGTVDPETIGQQVTAGCVRMRNQEVEELYNIIPIGTPVVIVD